MEFLAEVVARAQRPPCLLVGRQAVDWHGVPVFAQTTPRGWKTLSPNLLSVLLPSGKKFVAQLDSEEGLDVFREKIFISHWQHCDNDDPVDFKIVKISAGGGLNNVCAALQEYLGPLFPLFFVSCQQNKVIPRNLILWHEATQRSLILRESVKNDLNFEVFEKALTNANPVVFISVTAPEFFEHALSKPGEKWLNLSDSTLCTLRDHPTLLRSIVANADLVICNRVEARLASTSLLKMARNTCVTLGPSGLLFFVNGQVGHVPAFRVDGRHLPGTGDVLVAGLTLLRVFGDWDLFLQQPQVVFRIAQAFPAAFVQNGRVSLLQAVLEVLKGGEIRDEAPEFSAVWSPR
ncbi:MAG: hypothetical protein QXO67_04110 [Candidatus Bathyarchaeia archaeon]